MSKSWKIQNGNYLSAQSVWIEPNTTGSSSIDGKNLSTALKNLGSDIIPVTRGGTGAKTPLSARQALEVVSSVNSTSFSSVSLATGTSKTIASLALDPGTYVLMGGVQFGKNATGWRGCWITTVSTGGIGVSGESARGMSEANTFLHAIWTTRISAKTTYYFRAYQNSGGALNVTGGFRALRFTFY